MCFPKALPRLRREWPVGRPERMWGDPFRAQMPAQAHRTGSSGGVGDGADGEKWMSSGNVQVKVPGFGDVSQRGR